MEQVHFTHLNLSRSQYWKCMVTQLLKLGKLPPAWFSRWFHLRGGGPHMSPPLFSSAMVSCRRASLRYRAPISLPSPLPLPPPPRSCLPPSTAAETCGELS